MSGSGRPQSWIFSVVRCYTRAVETIASIGMVVLLGVSANQVFTRYVLNSSSFWSEEFMRYLMIWCAFFSAGLSYTRGRFLGMRMLIDATPPAAKTIADFIGVLAIVSFLLVVSWYGFEFALGTADTRAVALQFSMFWVHVSVPVGCILLALHVTASFFFPHDHVHGQELL
jgi:TRAP-type C4-dicarboxylate transport system permease small subunit